MKSVCVSDSFMPAAWASSTEWSPSTQEMPSPHAMWAAAFSSNSVLLKTRPVSPTREERSTSAISPIRRPPSSMSMSARTRSAPLVGADVGADAVRRTSARAPRRSRRAARAAASCARCPRALSRCGLVKTSSVGMFATCGWPWRVASRPAIHFAPGIRRDAQVGARAAVAKPGERALVEHPRALRRARPGARSRPPRGRPRRGASRARPPPRGARRRARRAPRAPSARSGSAISAQAMSRFVTALSHSRSASAWRARPTRARSRPAKTSWLRAAGDADQRRSVGGRAAHALGHPRRACARATRRALGHERAAHPRVAEHRVDVAGARRGRPPRRSRGRAARARARPRRAASGRAAHWRRCGRRAGRSSRGGSSRPAP